MSEVRAHDLSAYSFTAGLTADDIGKLAGLARVITVAAGQRIFSEGEPATRLWLITSGRVALDLQAPGHSQLTIETLGHGDELGLSWLTPIAQWQFGALAQLAVTAFEFDSVAVQALCEADHELGYRLTQRLLATAIARLQAARIRILDLYAPAPPGTGSPR